MPIIPAHQMKPFKPYKELEIYPIKTLLFTLTRPKNIVSLRLHSQFPDRKLETISVSINIV